MDNPLENSKDVENVIRAALGEWAKRIERNPVPDFAQKITLVSVSDKTAYAGFLRCLFDVRTGPTGVVIPYNDEALIKVAPKDDPWTLPVKFSKQFLEQEETVVASETGQPEACGRCSGENSGETCETCEGAKTVACDACSQTGRKGCPACKGRGKISCSLCAGSGKVVQSVAQDGTRIEETCPQCTGKKELPCHDCADVTASDCAKCANTRRMECPKCGGRGAALCAQCGGSRQIVRGYSYQIAYKIAYYRSIVRDPAVPEEVFPADPPLGKLGDTLLDLEGDDPAAFAAKKPAGPAGDAFARVLALVPAAGLGPNSKRIMQALSVEKIPIYEVTYNFEGKDYHAWVGRYENRVIALDDPFADLAGRWADTAEGMLDRGELQAFDALAAKAEALAPRNPVVAALRAKAGAVQRRAVMRLGAPASFVLAAAVPGVLAFVYSSPNRFMPLAALGASILILSLLAVWRLAVRVGAGPLVTPSKRSAWTLGAAAAGAVLPIALFLALTPIRRIDVAEFEKKISDFESRPLESLTSDDDAALNQLIKDYAWRGVDTSAAQNLLDAHATMVAAAHAEQLRQEEAAREQARRAAAAARAAAQAEREEAAREAAERAAAARRAAAAKKKKKKKKKKSVPTD